MLILLRIGVYLYEGLWIGAFVWRIEFWGGLWSGLSGLFGVGGLIRRLCLHPLNEEKALVTTNIVQYYMKI